jgi:AcrR family transcriptional regulator
MAEAAPRPTPGRTGAVSGAATRERVLAAAALLFQEGGYQGASVAAIARLAGISPAALYWHFDSKRDILLAFLEQALTEFVASCRAAVTADDPDERLRQFVAAHVSRQVRQSTTAGAYARVYNLGQLLAELTPRQRARMVDLQRTHVDLCRAILRDGQRTGRFVRSDVTVTAFAIISLCEHVITWFKPSAHGSVDTLVRRYAELASRMARYGG